MDDELISVVITNNIYVDKLYHFVENYFGVDVLNTTYLYDCLNQLLLMYLSDAGVVVYDHGILEDNVIHQDIIQSILSDKTTRSGLGYQFSRLVGSIQDQLPDNTDLVELHFPGIPGTLVVRYLLYVN